MFSSLHYITNELLKSSATSGLHTSYFTMVSRVSYLARGDSIATLLKLYGALRVLYKQNIISMPSCLLVPEIPLGKDQTSEEETHNKSSANCVSCQSSLQTKQNMHNRRPLQQDPTSGMYFQTLITQMTMKSHSH